MGAASLLGLMRSEIRDQTARADGISLGFVRRIGANIAIQVMGRELILQKDELLILDSYTPVRGDRVLLVPVTNSQWCVIGAFDPA